MALSLQDFNKPADMKQMRMDAFQPRTTPSPAANPATINTLASYGAALTPDGNLDAAYKSIATQLQYSSSSDTLNNIIKQWDDNDIQASMSSLKGVLVDPTVPDEEKQNILHGFQTGQWQNSLASRVATTSAEAPSEGENGEQESLRVRIAAGFNEVDSYNGWVQKNLNALNGENNISWQNNVKAMVESFLPFGDAARSTMFEQIVDLEGTGDAGDTVRMLTLLGEGREELRSTLAAIPLEERRTVVQNIINVIKSGSGPTVDNLATMRQIEMMNLMLTPGAYDDADRWADNIFSVLDDTILLSPLRKGLGAFRAAAAGQDGARVAEEVIARGERAVASTEASPQLLIEYKPAPVSFTDDIDAIVDNLPVEPTSAEITNLRESIMSEVGNPNFSIDNVIDNANIVDKLTSAQVDDIRAAIGRIRDKRTADLNGQLPAVNPNGITTEDIINNLPVEPTSDEIADLRNLINSGATNEDIINSALVVDKMTAEQITELRVSLREVRLAGPRRAHISGNVQPTSVSQIHKDTNPAQARISHNAVVADESGQAARILYGTDRDSAIGNDFLPEIGGNDGRVRAKMEFDEATAVPDQRILKNVKESDGAIWASENEKKELQNRVIKEWKQTLGVANRSAMNTLQDLKPSVKSTGNGIRFNQVFGPKDGGFSNAFTGVDSVKAALRKYGVTDEDVTILARQSDGNYAPADPKMDMSNGDFLVQVKHDYVFDPNEVKYEGFEVSKMWGFIKVPDINAPDMLVPGGITQHIVPKAVNIDQRVYAAGVSAADKSAGLAKQLTTYQKKMLDKWKKLPKAQKDLVDQYIRIANDEELTFNVAKIKARGISDDGVAMLVDWKTVQDTLYALENQDVNRTLRQRGYQIFESRATDTKLIVEPVGKSTIPANTRIYDVGRDDFIVLSQKNIDDLYEKGGTIVRPRNGEDFINGRPIQYILSPNDASGYSRRIVDSDTTLNYRQGYYHIRYDDPYFITKTDKNGKTSTIARAESRRDAEAEARRLADTKDGNTYDWKHDKYTTPDANFDDNLSVAFAAGRSSQRLRGKRLQRVGSDKTISDLGLESPIDSLTRSIASVATRTSFRNVLEGSKRRWMSQFKHLLGPGVHKFPKDISEIRTAPGSNEARHAYRYISGLQDGYANLIDDASKAFFNAVSDVAGAKGWGWVDKMAKKASQVSPSSTARLTAFRLYLASNPLGQSILQMAPALPIISSLNPLGWGRVVRQAAILGAFHRGVDVSTSIKVGKYAGVSVEDMKELVKDYELSGMSSAVNAHLYVSDDMEQLANRNVLQKGLSVLGKPLRITQSIGFDFGEQTLMSLVWLSERDRLTRRLGRNKLTAAEREQLTAQTRAITGDMNKGGEMPYNSNTFSVLMQFLQAPHKMAAGLLLGHKGISWQDRAKLMAGYTVTFGVPAVPIIDQFVDKLMPPDDPQAREIVKGGMANLVLNKMLSAMSGEDVGVDFSGRLQPFSTKPMIEFAHGILTGTIPEMVSGAAAPSLLSEGGRIGEFVKAVAAPFTPGNYEGVDEYKQMGLAFMQMFTGVSNTMKAHYMLELGKITTRSGQVVDDDVSFMEALGKAAGFSTIDEARYWESNKAQWEISDEITSDIEKVVDNLFVLYTRQGEDVADFEIQQRVIAEASRVFNNNPIYMEKVADYYDFKANQSPDALFEKLFKNSGLYSPEQAVKIINESNMSQDQIDTLMEMYNIAGDSYGD